MAYANAHVKVTLFGTMAGGQEEWSTGFRMGGEDSGGGNFGIPAGFVEALLPLWQTFFTAPASKIHNSYKTTGIKAAIILPDGKTDLGEVVTIPYGAPITGSNGGVPQAPQVALVAQLAASSPVGLGAKGRMYLPGINAALDDNLRISEGDCTGIANGLRTFLDAAESTGSSPGYVINASKGRPGVPFTAPVNRRVVSVRVGNVYDTQRRRRNALTETYTAAALAA